MTTTREGILGPSYFHHRRLIAESRHWSAAEIAAYQRRQTERLIRRYGDQITSKDGYRQDPGRYSRWGVPLLTRSVGTGGSSGQPLRFRADTYARRQKERAYLFDIWSRVGYSPCDLRVVYRGVVTGGMLAYNRLENSWNVSPDATTADRLDRLREWARRLPPFFLHIYPSSLYTFIDLVGEDLFRELPVRGVLAGSEGFAQGEIERFERQFGLAIAHWYGHSEYAVLAYHCRKCTSFHFYPTYGQAELVGSDDDQGLRRIVATSFNWVGTQFVRYDTGDLATAATGDCDDNFLRVATIVGRAQEAFTDSAGRRRSLLGYIFGIHQAFFWEDIRDLQFIQDVPGSLRAELVVTAAADRERIEKTIRQRMPMVNVDFAYVAAIERRPNGKRRYFVDNLRHDG